MTTQFDYRKGFVINPGARSEDIDGKAPYVDHGTGLIDPRRYFDQDYANLEWDRMWTRTWTMAGYACDIPEVGDYFKYDIGPVSIIVLRVSPTEIRAFHNVCHHRGNRLVNSDFGNLGSCFHCSFHGWEYDFSGKLTVIRDEDLFRTEVIADRPGLTPVRCDAWASFVFVTLNPDAAPLQSFLDVIPEHLKAFPFERFRPFRDLELVWDANWKTALEAFLEFYHADDVHPEVICMTETYGVQYDLYANGHGRMILPVGLPNKFKDGDTVIEPVRQTLKGYGGDPKDYPDVAGRGFKAALTDTKRKWAERNGLDYFTQLTDGQITDDWNYFFFPNMTFNVFCDGLLVQRFLPHPTDPNKSVYLTQTLAIPVPDPEHEVFDINLYGPAGNGGPKNWDGTDRPTRDKVTDFSQLGYVLAQDARLVPEVQAGLRNPAFKGARLNEAEVRIRHYLAELDKYLGKEPGSR